MWRRGCGRSVAGMIDEAKERRARLARRRPGLYASRHVVVGVAQVLLVVLGIRLAFGLVDLPDISIPVPEIDLPDVLPEIPFGVPGWLAAVLASAKYWAPIVFGVFFALGELERRRRRS